MQEHDMTDQISKAGLSRRSMLKRSAVVGGTIAWVTPVVTTFNTPALGQDNGSPITGFSYVAGTVSCSGGGLDGVYRWKFEEGTGQFASDPGTPGQGNSGIPVCISQGMVPAGWVGSQVLPNPGSLISVSQDGDILTLTLNANSGCTFEFLGGVEGVQHEGQNCAFAVENTGDSLVFDTSLTNNNP
jgi:hypothetical protein